MGHKIQRQFAFRESVKVAWCMLLANDNHGFHTK